MVLILSIQNDMSTFYVCDWLERYKLPFVIVYPETEVTIENINITNDGVNFSMLVGDKLIKYESIKVLWYRRGQLNFNVVVAAKNYIQKYLNNEFKSIESFIIRMLNLLPSINKIGDGTVNKLVLLEIAQKVGLMIPSSTITRVKQKAAELRGPKITKSISEGRVTFGKNMYSHGTEMLDDRTLEMLADNFFYSLIQEYQHKIIEVRVFHLYGVNFAMGILSQSNENTRVDYRNYDYDNPNRFVPIILPDNVANKINSLMHFANLNCGSIDLILNDNNEYVFLEVNPVGQYDMISFPCNYNLHKLIADKICELYISREVCISH